MRKNTNIISLILVTCILTAFLYGCGQHNETPASEDASSSVVTSEIAKVITAKIAEEAEEQATIEASDEENIELVQEQGIDYFVYKKIFDEYSTVYDTFDAVVTLSDGTEVYGVGYSDFSSYFEPDDGAKGFFPAGFLIDGGDVNLPDKDVEDGLEVENLTYSNDDFGFVLAYKTEPYYEHCVINGQYVKYGIDESGKITHTECDYSKDVCDLELGSLYSYDDSKYLYNADVGNYVELSGQSLYETVDFNKLEAEINRILDEQDFNFSSVEVNTTLKFAQEAVSEYLNQFHEESFMGISTKRLLEEVKNLDLNQCIRFSPDGNVIVDVKDRMPDEPTSLAKWLVGFSCGIAMAGSVAVKTFVPALWPASEAINGAAIDIFIQVVFENVSVEDINWSKVGIAAMSAAVMAWACPLGTSKITENLARQTGSQLLAKLGGYGFKTFSNSIILGSTNAAFTAIDNGSQEEIWDSFRVGAAVGACCTIAASALEEAGQAGMKALEYSHPDNWLVKLKDGAMMFINNHQYHLKNAALESILAPKSVYEAAQAGMYQYNKQVTLISGKRGGSYNEVKANSIGEYTQVHETPSYSSTNPTGSRSEMNGPSIKMTTEDHRLTASYGSSRDAIQYRAEQKRLIEQGNYHDAIQMDIEDIQSKFGTKYDAAIDEMLEYAKSIGWW